jgi:hypothetical protein
MQGTETAVDVPQALKLVKLITLSLRNKGLVSRA